MRAAVALDAWKLPIFESHLKAGGFTYTHAAPLVPGTCTLYVEAESADALRPTIIAAERECKEQKKMMSTHRTTFTHNGGKKGKGG